LVSECAYEQWHQLLFARFLAENNLLLHPQLRAPVTLEDCEDLATSLGEPDGWSLAARFAAEILPGIFRIGDPCVSLHLAPEGRFALEQVIAGLPAEVFVADDALGWVYQFWQKDKKDEINASERKIGGADLGPVTQLFTENYMVRFLLENSLGAWWASHHPDSPLVGEFDYLRLDDEKKPAAGSFDGWPERVAEVTVMDPCCGSGHFLVEAFSMLWQMRAEEEGLSPVDAQDAVLRDNLFGLELDSRCVQIAMFAVALQAWKAGGGWRQLPVPNIACSGITVKAPLEEWKKLADGDFRLESALARLHILFRDADTLGSLIEPRRSTELIDPTAIQHSFDDVNWTEVSPLLAKACERELGDPATAVLGADAVGIARAVLFLRKRYTLIATNVPYLAKRKQTSTLIDYCSAFAAPSDLALVFLERIIKWVDSGCGIAIVAPNKWRFQTTFSRLRSVLLRSSRIVFIADLGARAFSANLWDFNVDLLSVRNAAPTPRSSYLALSVADLPSPSEKGLGLREVPFVHLSQPLQLNNPDERVLTESSQFVGAVLGTWATAVQGIATGDDGRFRRRFWELPEIACPWQTIQSSVSTTVAYGGRTDVADVEGASRTEASRIQGQRAWGQAGVSVSAMASLPTTLYSGGAFDMNATVIVPDSAEKLPALWAFVSSAEFLGAVRRIEAKLNVTTATVAKVMCDFDRWKHVAEEAGPLPEPWSDDPTQWLFAGRPEVSAKPLQVAVGRLLGYRWPEQSEGDDRNAFADDNGIVCLPSVAGEPPAADRLQEVLAAAFGEMWSPAKAKELLREAGGTKKNLDEWLRDEFFKQHCALFENRPFVWHIWDGQRDGFSVLVNYHRLNRQTLEKLIYTYLGQDWVERQRAGVRDEVAGADGRLRAALALQQKLEAILEGEKPFDIYVRWKQLHEQSIGWEPDLNDGVRVNIRPFVEAGVLRVPFNIHWKKDRGKNPDGTERFNDIHRSLAEKLEARRKAGQT
jgi:hypothetical protein